MALKLRGALEVWFDPETGWISEASGKQPGYVQHQQKVQWIKLDANGFPDDWKNCINQLDLRITARAVETQVP